MGGEPTRLEIGDRNTIREFCTFNLGTVQDAGVTRLGNDNWISAYVHLAHDCQVGSNTIFSNNAQLAGHVQVGDWAILSRLRRVHQFCKIGAHAFIGMNTSLTQDVPPFVLVVRQPGRRARRQHRRPEAARLHAPTQIDGAAQRLQAHLPSRPDAGRSQGRAGGAAGRPARQGRRRTWPAMRDFLDNASRGIVR